MAGSFPHPLRSLAGEARAARHQAVLDEATQEFNRAGVSGASLGDIASRVGITRAGLYNYCEDRRDLVYQCYLRACALAQSDLNRALESEGDAIEQVNVFLRLALGPEHPPVAALTELGMLTPEQEAEVRAARTRNFAALREILAGGVRAGVVRPMNLDLVSRAIFGILTWTLLSRVWTNNPDESLLRRLAAVVPMMIADGVATEGTAIPQSRVLISDVIPNLDLHDRPEALARAGSDLFNRRGIDGVSLDDVAAAVGLTKGAVYHYFKSKPAFVAYCYDRAFNIFESIMDMAGAAGTGIQCTMQLVDLTIQAQLEDIHTLWPTTGYSSLSEPLQRHLSERSNFLVGRSAELSRRGIVDGTIRNLDLLPMRLASAGAQALLSQWLPEGETHSTLEISREIVGFLCHGLRRRAA